jgi:hypothetical protein
LGSPPISVRAVPASLCIPAAQVGQQHRLSAWCSRVCQLRLQPLASDHRSHLAVLSAYNTCSSLLEIPEAMRQSTERRQQQQQQEPDASWQVHTWIQCGRATCPKRVATHVCSLPQRMR